MSLNKFPRMGMSPDVWGPLFWSTMHIATLGYPVSPTEQDQLAATHFYESLSVMIPCPICRDHYSQTLMKMPIKEAVKGRDELINWVFTIHNEVNKQLGKSEITWETYVQTMYKLALQTKVNLIPTEKSPLQSSLTANGIALVLGVVVGGAAYAWYTTKVKN